MNFKTTYVLFAVLFGVLGIFLLTQLFGNRSADQRTYILPSMHDITAPVRTADIDRIEIDRTEKGKQPEKIEFYRDGQNNWRMKEPDTRADTNLVDRIIDQVMQAKRNQEADMSSDLAAYGLDSPSAIVKLFKKDDDKAWTVSEGAASPGDSTAMVYVTTSDSPKDPMAVRKMDLDTLSKPRDEYRSKTLLADSSFDIQSVKFDQPKHDEVSLEKDKENHWRFDKPAWGDADYEGETSTAPAGESSPKKITGVRDLLQAVVDLRVANDKDFGPAGASDAKLAELGLEKGKEKLEIEVKRQPSFSADNDKKEPISDKLLIGNKADEKGESLWARLASEHNAVKVPAKKVDEILQAIDNPSVLRNHDLVAFDSAKVDAIDLQPQGQPPIKLRHAGEPVTWKVYEGGKSEAADDSAVQSLLTALTTKHQIKDFPSLSKSDAELGLDKPSAIVAVWVEGLKKEDKKEEKKEEKKEGKAKEASKGKDEAKNKAKKEEPKKPAETEPAFKDPGKPTVRLVFGKKDKDTVYVRREEGKDVTRLAVPATLLDKASEGRLAYLDRKLPALAFSAEISKVSISRGSETYEVQKNKDDKTNTWKIEQPKNLKGRNADSGKVDHLLEELRNLQVDKLVAENPSDTVLERYGLKKPAEKAVVTVTKPDKKTEVFVYDFGNEGEDKSKVYARVNGRDVVFLTPKSTVDALQGDLQDTVVLPFDTAKIKALKLVGWQDIIGNPFTLDLDKNGKEWKAKSPADYKVDQLSLSAFLAGLNHLKAERFLGKTLKPEYKLGVKEGALELTFIVEGEKEPTILSVGAPTGTGYYATCSRMPGEVFVAPKAPFEAARAKPAYFKPQ
jgi:Domain of unknown function (DUF4340)